MTAFAFFIPGQPHGKGRSRSRFDRAGHYPDPKSAKLEKSIAWIAHNAMINKKPLTGPILLVFEAISLQPASWPKKRRCEFWKTSKPDIDNLEKLIKDALNRVAWLDDAQVCAVVKTKHYGDVEGIQVTIAELSTAL